MVQEDMMAEQGLPGYIEMRGKVPRLRECVFTGKAALTV